MLLDIAIVVVVTANVALLVLLWLDKD